MQGRGDVKRISRHRQSPNEKEGHGQNLVGSPTDRLDVTWPISGNTLFIQQP